jgi:hypothetical protein
MNTNFLNSPPLSMRWRWLNWPANARRTLTLGYFVFLNWLLLAPASTFRDVHVFLSHQDKVAHFGIFAGLTGLVLWSTPASWGNGKPQVFLILTLLAYGAGIECLQPLMPDSVRTFEWMDLLMDCVGVAFGVWLCEHLARKEPAQKRSCSRYNGDSYTGRHRKNPKQVRDAST